MADIRIVGTGTIGDKAAQLQEKGAALERIGFSLPERTVFAEGYFDPFFSMNGFGVNLRDVTPAADLDARIRAASLTGHERELLAVELARLPSNVPVMVRSSAAGDARGTGTYESVGAQHSLPAVEHAMREVLASYFTPSAIAFRKDAGTGEGFGIIIEPLIGTTFDAGFAPVLSGFGYTSTSRGEGFVNIVPGFGGGVSSRDGERITRAKIAALGANLGTYLDERKEEFILERHDGLRKLPSALMGGQHGTLYAGQYPGRVAAGGKSLLRFDIVDLYLENTFGDAFEDIALTPFFTMMDEMETQFGRPQYFEWALTLDGATPRYWLTQIADVDRKIDTVEFSDVGTLLFTAHTVTGVGVKECEKIAHCWNIGDLAGLYEFNQHHTNYALIFSSRLTTTSRSTRLEYRDFSNASVFLEIQDARHSGDPLAHLGGQFDATHKFFGVMDYHADEPLNWGLFHSREAKEYGMSVYQGKVRAVASERKDKMIVGAID